MNQPVSSLNLPKYLINKLENAGFHYCDDVKNSFESNNSKLTIPNISKVAKAPKSKTAFELYQEESTFQPLKTFIPELDLFLSGEVIPGSVTELCGLPGTGKTQICLHLSVGADGKVVFIHTNKNLNPQRLKEIAVKFEVEEAFIEKILCIEAADTVELMASVQFLESWLPDQKNVRLLIIDSITWPLKQQTSTDRSPIIFTLFQNLRILANLYNFPIVVTNNLTTRVEGDETYHTSSFGDSFYHLINNRILLCKEENLFKAKTLKSVSGCQHAISFQL